MSLKIAIMQPYFFPYAGYFRLFAAADIFVALDCVQFPRRGWVHRNQLTDNNGESQWLTLPLIKGDRDTTRIHDLQFQPDALHLMKEQFRRFTCLTNIQSQHSELSTSITNFESSPVQYLVNNLQTTTKLLGISKPIIFSSELEIPIELKAQDRIIEIAKRAGAAHYINAPGGREIYDAQSFLNAGLTLNFLPDYKGSFKSVLERILTEEPEKIAQEIISNTSLDRAN